MFGTGSDLFAVMLLFLLHFFVVRDIAWISHAPMVRAGGGERVGHRPVVLRVQVPIRAETMASRTLRTCALPASSAASASPAATAAAMRR